MHEVLVNRLGGLSLPRKSVVRLTDRPDITLDVYRGRKTTIQPTNHLVEQTSRICSISSLTIKVVFQIRRGNRDDFPCFSIKICYDPSLELSCRDGYEGPHYMFKWRDKTSYLRIILNISTLSGALLKSLRVNWAVSL